MSTLFSFVLKAGHLGKEKTISTLYKLAYVTSTKGVTEKESPENHLKAGCEHHKQ